MMCWYFWQSVRVIEEVSQIKEDVVSTGTGDEWKQNYIHENKKKYNKFKAISDNGQTSTWRGSGF